MRRMINSSFARAAGRSVSNNLPQVADAAQVFKHLMLQDTSPVPYELSLFMAVVAAILGRLERRLLFAAGRFLAGNGKDQTALQIELRLVDGIGRRLLLFDPVGGAVAIEPIGRPPQLGSQIVEGILGTVFELDERDAKSFDRSDRANVNRTRHVGLLFEKDSLKVLRRPRRG